jgi:hypothetical protein
MPGNGVPVLSPTVAGLSPLAERLLRSRDFFKLKNVADHSLRGCGVLGPAPLRKAYSSIAEFRLEQPSTG